MKFLMQKYFLIDGDSFIIHTEDRSRLINLLPYLSTEYIS